jgi:hypothetical protein
MLDTAHMLPSVISSHGSLLRAIIIYNTITLHHVHTIVTHNTYWRGTARNWHGTARNTVDRHDKFSLYSCSFMETARTLGAIGVLLYYFSSTN